MNVRDNCVTQARLEETDGVRAVSLSKRERAAILAALRNVHGEDILFARRWREFEEDFKRLKEFSVSELQALGRRVRDNCVTELPLEESDDVQATWLSKCERAVILAALRFWQGEDVLFDRRWCEEEDFECLRALHQFKVSALARRVKGLLGGPVAPEG